MAPTVGGLLPETGDRVPSLDQWSRRVEDTVHAPIVKNIEYIRRRRSFGRPIQYTANPYPTHQFLAKL
jgi:hypothetical protein